MRHVTVALPDQSGAFAQLEFGPSNEILSALIAVDRPQQTNLESLLNSVVAMVLVQSPGTQHAGRYSVVDWSDPVTPDVRGYVLARDSGRSDRHATARAALVDLTARGTGHMDVTVTVLSRDGEQSPIGYAQHRFDSYGGLITPAVLELHTVG